MLRLRRLNHPLELTAVPLDLLEQEAERRGLELRAIGAAVTYERDLASLRTEISELERKFNSAMEIAFRLHHQNAQLELEATYLASLAMEGLVTTLENDDG